MPHSWLACPFAVAPRFRNAVPAGASAEVTGHAFSTRPAVKCKGPCRGRKELALGRIVYDLQIGKRVVAETHLRKQEEEKLSPERYHKGQDFCVEER